MLVPAEEMAAEMMTDMIIKVAQNALRFHLECRHLDPWSAGLIRKQHYTEARKHIAVLRVLQ